MISRGTRWALLLFPLVFFAVNRTWMYTVNENLDAWKCAGYFLHPELMYPRMPEAYPGSRVLHNFLGWLALRWLPVPEGLFIYKGSLFYAGYLFLFGALRALFRNERAALIGAALGLTNGLALYILNWDYTFSTCLVLLLGTLWAQARMRDAGKRLWAWEMAAGAFYVGGVWNYPFIATVAPLVFALFVYGLPRWTWTELAKGLGWAALGGLGITLAQVPMSRAMDGPWLYFVPQLVHGASFVGGDFFTPLEYWWRGAVWLPYLGLVLALAALGIWRGGKLTCAVSPERPIGRWAPLPYAGMAYVGALALFAVFQWFGIWLMLQNCQLASFLFPFAFLVAGGWVAWLLAGLKERAQWLVVAAGLGMILLVYGGGFYWHQKWPTTWFLWLVLVLLAAALAGAGARSRAALMTALVFVSSLAGLNMYLATRQYYDPALLAGSIAQNEALFDTVRMIDEWNRAGQTWLWFGFDRPNGRIERELSYFYLGGGGQTIGEKFPALIGGTIPLRPVFTRPKFTLRPGMRVLLFDTTAAEIASAQAALAERGLQLKPLAQAESPGGGAIKPMRLELWEAVPTGQTQGIAVDLTKAEMSAGVEREAEGRGTIFNYPAGETEPVWQMELPESMTPKAGGPAGLLKMRIGANERKLRLILTDEQHKILAETMVDPGTAVRDWWLELPPGAVYRYLEVRPKESDAGGYFTVEGAEY